MIQMIRRSALRMRQWLARRLHRLAAWIWTPPPAPPRPVRNPILARSAVLVDALERRTPPGASGEYKRHVVYAKLLTEFPAARPRDIALLLETAVQEVLN